MIWTTPPETGSQAGDLETIPQEPTFLPDGNGMDNDSSSDADRDGGSEGRLMDSDSESDEFKSDEEGVGCQDGPRVDRGLLEFELRAAEAGNVLC